MTSNETPQFELQQKDFLVDGMVDFGRGASPTFVDVNADGLLDLVVGNETYFVDGPNTLDARLHLFENIGTATQPNFRFTIVTNGSYCKFANVFLAKTLK